MFKSVISFYPSRELIRSKSSVWRRRQMSRVFCVERLEDRTVFDAGWVAGLQGVMGRIDSVGDQAGNSYVVGQVNQQATIGTAVLAASEGSMFAAKVDANGQFLWAVQFGKGSSGSGTNIADVAADGQGNLYIAGSFDGTAAFGSQTLVSSGGTDGYVLKMDSTSGRVTWTTGRGGAGSDRLTDLALDGAGNIVAVGVWDAVPYVTKIAPDATDIWSTKMSSGEAGLAGAFSSVEIDSQGAIYASGSYSGTASFPTGTLVSSPSLPNRYNLPPREAIVTKLDNNGEWAWAKSFASDTYSTVTDTALGRNGRLYIGGWLEGTAQMGSTSLSSLGARDGFVASLDAQSGTPTWAVSFGGAGNDASGPLLLNSASQVVLSGSIEGTATFGPRSLTADFASNTFLSLLNASGAFLDVQHLGSGTASSIGGLYEGSGGAVFASGSGAGRTHLPQTTLQITNSIGFVTKLPPLAPTKFFVVDDQVRDRTFHYAASGELTVDHFALSTGNFRPSGVASNVAGDRLWTIDRSGTVYVYSATGAQLGTWTMGGITASSVIEGITTNGTDIWVVDKGAGKVLRYAGAASRLTGSQSPSSTFRLNSKNSGAADLVTDGVSIWVVDNNTADRVYKYSLTGTLLGTWTIGTAGASSPTGITLNPAAPSELWIVDNASDLIFQYNAAVGVTSGTLTAAKVFPLAVGNTNPQGIADPPVPGTELASYSASPLDEVASDSKLESPSGLAAPGLTAAQSPKWSEKPTQGTEAFFAEFALPRQSSFQSRVSSAAVGSEPTSSLAGQVSSEHEETVALLSLDLELAWISTRKKIRA